MQSEPYRRPPITTTCLRLAEIAPMSAAGSPAIRRFCCGSSPSRMDAAKLASRDRQVARGLGAAGQHHGVESSVDAFHACWTPTCAP